MSASTLAPTGFAAPDLSLPVKLWTVDEYHRLIQLGMLAEGSPVELLDGAIVYKDRGEGGQPMTHGPRHAQTLAQLVSLSERFRPLGAHLRCQLPLTIAPNHEPEPDATIVGGGPRDYRDRSPSAQDCHLVVEVADTSLATDRGRKQRIYAMAEIAQYWIVNLQSNTLEVYEEPDAQRGEYRIRRDHLLGEVVVISLPGSGSVEVRVDEILG